MRGHKPRTYTTITQAPFAHHLMFIQSFFFPFVSFPPTQSGRCDGYILEGAELQFYLKKISKKK